MAKRLLALLLGMWLGRTPVSAQIRVIDSLQRQLAAHPQADAMRLRLLNELARPLAFDDTLRSHALANEARQLARRLRNPPGEALALANIAFGYAQAYEPAKAMPLVQQGLAIATRTGDLNLLARLTNVLGLVNYQMERNEAVAILQRAEQYARRAGNFAEQAFALALLGRISRLQADNDHGLDYLLRAMKAARQAGDSRQLAQALNNLGSLFLYSQDYPQALRYGHQGVAVARQAQLLSTLNVGLNGLGEIYRLMGDYPRAEQAYQASIRLATKRGAWAIESNDRANLADVYDRQGRYALMLSTVNLAVDTLMRHRAVGRGLSYLSWAWVVQARALLHLNQPARALPVALKSYESAEVLYDVERKRDAAQVLAAIYARLGDPTRAYRYQLRYTTFQDSMSNDVLRRNVAVVQFNAELDKQQAQIGLLRKQQNDQTQAVRRQRLALIISLVSLFLVGGSLVITYRSNRQKQRTNVQLAEAYQNVEQLSRMGQQIAANLDIERIVRSLYQSVGQFMDAALLGIGTLDTDQEQLNFPATVERGKRLPPYHYDLGEPRLAVHCVMHDAEIIIHDYDREREQYAGFQLARQPGDETQSLVYLPLRVNERVVGVLTVQSFRPNTYSDNQRNLLRNLANYAAVALANAEAYGTLNQTLQTLKTTQNQLIQAEKLASLGELTAGIAHEIQNPLNFVNNFSEVSADLLTELRDEVAKPNPDRTFTNELLDDLVVNLGKITQHGKRASSIVRGMLEHSRMSNGQKEPTNLNALVDEYLRLAYHGMRAKDKADSADRFNAQFTTDLDPHIGQVRVMPQEIGRVLLNLYTNAFHAVQTKAASANAGNRPGADEYQPTVTVSTQRLSDAVVIRVRDNGTGISDAVRAKIFQPFFTTKPAGKGTGLGLSLSYDIVTKGHAGKLHVDSVEGQGTEFTVYLPTTA